MGAGQIRKELEAAEKYKLALIKNDLVALTEDNVARVEAMIHTDSNYRTSINDDEKSPYWIREMGKSLRGEPCAYEFEEIVDKIVDYLDKENSTHLEADQVGRGEMKERIRAWNGLLESLENRDHGFELIDFLSKPTHPRPGSRSRRNISFASKFCHYSCLYIFDGKEAQDNFSIYDGVVAKALPKYLDHYEINKEFKIRDKGKNNYYEKYSEAIDAIIEASGSEISRNGFDHLVWYYFKGKR